MIDQESGSCQQTPSPGGGFSWIVPPWQLEDTLEDSDPDDPGRWPYVGSPFLAAFRFFSASDRKVWWWEFVVLKWDESGLVHAGSGDSYTEAGPHDMDWIAKIPVPKPRELENG